MCVCVCVCTFKKSVNSIIAPEFSEKRSFTTGPESRQKSGRVTMLNVLHTAVSRAQVNLKLLPSHLLTAKITQGNRVKNGFYE